MTHPDADHINGAGKVMRGLQVGTLPIHRPWLHGFPSNSGAAPAEELVRLALEQGSQVIEPFTPTGGFADSMLVAGPTAAYYEEMLSAQEGSARAGTSGGRSLAQRFYGTAVATLGRPSTRSRPRSSSTTLAVRTLATTARRS